MGVRRGAPTAQQGVELAGLGPPFSDLGPSERENWPTSWKATVKLSCLSFAGGLLLCSSPAMAAAESVARHCLRHITRKARPQLWWRAKSKVSIRSTGSWTTMECYQKCSQKAYAGLNHSSTIQASAHSQSRRPTLPKTLRKESQLQEAPSDLAMDVKTIDHLFRYNA